MYLQWTGQLGTGDDALDVNVRDLAVVELGGGTFLYATNGATGGLTAYALDASGAVATLIDQELYSGVTATAAAGLVEFARIDGTDQLIFGSVAGGDLMGFALAADGTFQGSGDITPLSGTTSQIGNMAMAETGTASHIYMVDSAEGSLTIHSLPTAPSQSGPSSQTTAFALGTGSELRTVDIGPDTYLLATDMTTNGLTSYRVSETTGALTQISSMGAAQGIGIHLPTALETVTAFGETFAILGAAGTGSLSVMQVAATGALTPVDHILDTRDTRFAGVTDIAVAQDGDRVFVVAGGADDGLSLFTLAPDGRLIYLQTMVHWVGSGMENVDQLSAAITGDRLQVFASSTASGGLTQLTIDLSEVTDAVSVPDGSSGQVLAGDWRQNMLIASDTGFDTLSGRGGDDVLIAGAAGSRLAGGTGIDRFVMHGEASYSQIADFTVGSDILDLSDFFFLRSLDQLTITSTSDGAQITFGGSVIDVFSNNGAALDADDLFPAGLVGPTRVLVLAPEVDDTMTGGAGADSFFGGDGNDTLFGLGGSDTLDGGIQDDSLYGGTGDDLLDGGDGVDWLDGEADNDTLFGGAGDDTLFGAGGTDTLSGGAGGDWLDGGDAADTITGDAGADTLFGGAGDDSLGGGDGDDEVWGGTGNDDLSGGAGNDSLGGADGNDTLSGGDGRDELWAGEGADVVRGGGDGDTVGGGSGNDLLYGDDGDDVIWGGWGDDTIEGGAGNDTIGAREGNDRISGGAGNDTIWAEPGDDTVHGDAGDDELGGGGGQDALFGDAGNDVLRGADGADALWGGDGDDSIEGQTGNDLIGGGAGNDFLIGGSGDDVAWANEGDDVVWGGWGRDTLGGGSGNDTLRGDEGDDALWGGWGNDLVQGGAGNDLMGGREGNDTLLGEDGDDEIWANAGDDGLWGGSGNDTLGGGTGNDTLQGGDGDDRLLAGGGDDTLRGGAGADVFVFYADNGDDRITDFTPGEDILQIAGTGFQFGTLPMVQLGSDVEISLGSGTITLEDTPMSALDSGDFDFI